MFAMFEVEFSGRNGAGDISVPGLQEGDKVINFYRPDGGKNEAWFRFVVKEGGLIEQIFTGDATSADLTALVLRTTDSVLT